MPNCVCVSYIVPAFRSYSGNETELMLSETHPACPAQYGSTGISSSRITWNMEEK